MGKKVYRIVRDKVSTKVERKCEVVYREFFYVGVHVAKIDRNVDSCMRVVLD